MNLPSETGEVGKDSGSKIPLCTKSSLLARIDILLSKAVRNKPKKVNLPLGIPFFWEKPHQDRLKNHTIFQI